MGSKVRVELIGGLLDERRETEREERRLQEEINRLCRMREALAAENTTRNMEDVQSLDRQIDDLRREQLDQIRKRKDICKMARTITAGD